MLSLTTDIPPPEFSLFDIIVFGVLAPTGYMLAHYFVFEYDPNAVQAPTPPQPHVASTPAPIKAPLEDVAPTPTPAPISQGADGSFDPGLHGGLNCESSPFATLPPLESVWPYLEKVYGWVSAYIVGSQAPSSAALQTPCPKVLRGHMPKPEWCRSDYTAALEPWPSSVDPFDDFLLFLYLPPQVPNCTFCIEVLVWCIFGSIAYLSWYVACRTSHPRRDQPLDRDAPSLSTGDIGPRSALWMRVLLALLGIGFCSTPLLQLTTNPWPLLKLQSMLGLVLAIAAALYTLSILLKLLGYQQPATLQEALYAFTLAGTYITVTLTRILNKYGCYQAVLEQAQLDLDAASHSYAEYVPGVCRAGLLIERWWYRAVLVVTRGSAVAEARTYATKYFWYVRPAEDYAAQAATQETPRVGTGVLDRALSWVSDAATSLSGWLDELLINYSAVGQEWARLYTNTKNKPAAGWESAVSLDDIAASNPTCTYKSAAKAKDPFTDLPIWTHVDFTSSRHCSCGSEWAATLDFRQKVQNFASAAPEELFPDLITPYANHLEHLISYDALFLYGGLLWAVPVLLTYYIVGAGEHAPVLFAYFWGYRALIGGVLERIRHQARDNADLRERYVSVMHDNHVTSLNYDNIVLHKHPELQPLEALVSMHMTPGRKQNIDALKSSIPLPESPEQLPASLAEGLSALAMPGGMWALAIAVVALLTGLALSYNRWWPLVYAKLKKKKKDREIRCVSLQTGCPPPN